MPWNFSSYRAKGEKKKHKKPDPNTPYGRRNMERLFNFQLQNKYDYCDTPGCRNKRNGHSVLCSKCRVHRWYYGHALARGLKVWEYQDDIDAIEGYLKDQKSKGFNNPECEQLGNIKAFLTLPEGSMFNIFSKIRVQKLETLVIRMVALIHLNWTQELSRPVIMNHQHLKMLVGNVITNHLGLKTKLGGKRVKVLCEYIFRNVSKDAFYIVKQIMKNNKEKSEGI